MNVRVEKVGLVLAVAMLMAACGGTPAAPAVPTAVPATATSAAPASTATQPAAEAPTTAPTEAPTEAPTATQPAAEATATTPRETVSFSWAAGSVTPADADDVSDIVRDLRDTPGILGGSGDEVVLNIQFDPTVITIEEIADLLDKIGHPVEPQ